MTIPAQTILLECNPPVTVTYCGNTYEVMKDIRKTFLPHPPCWYVQRMSDLRTSKRYYSRPEGAIAALLTERIVWEH